MWRAIDGWVFSTVTGPAYAAWGQTNPAGQPLHLVNAAILAADARRAPSIVDRSKITKRLGARSTPLRRAIIDTLTACRNSKAAIVIGPR